MTNKQIQYFIRCITKVSKTTTQTENLFQKATTTGFEPVRTSAIP